MRNILILEGIIVSKTIVTLLAVFAALTAHADNHATDKTEQPPKSFVETLMDGKAHVNLRYRYEHVDDDLVPANTANASTLRVALGWESGVWNNFSAFAELEHIEEIFTGEFREGPGPVDPGDAGRFPVVADPPDTELNRAYLKYDSERFWIKAGRQYLTNREAPFHRFLGTILWRQNWQSHDAITLNVAPTKDINFRYSYSGKVHRIFGDDAPEPFDEFDCDCHMFNAKYGGFGNLKLEAYAYLLDISNSPANAVDTYGIRANGAIPINDNLKLLYAGEFATQDEAEHNPANVDADYYLGEIGFAMTLPIPLLPKLTLKFDYEVLEGNGVTSFRTPLSTAHAFQGWADRFLTTPADGIEDFYITAIAPFMGGKFVLAYHMLESDQASYDYGDEFNIQYTRKFAKHYTFGAKAAFYDADRNATALTRAGGLRNNDVTRLWAWVQFAY